MPRWFLPKLSGTKGSARTAAMRFSTGTARELAEQRLSIRCVLTSARMIRGKRTSRVVRRTPAQVESASTWAW